MAPLLAFAGRIALIACAWIAMTHGGHAQTAETEKPAPARPEGAKPEPRRPPPKPQPSQSSSKPQPQAQPAAPAEAPAPAPVAGPGELQPVLHARDANVAVCMDHVVAQSGLAIDTRHTAASTWSTQVPDANPFTSIVALSYNNPVAPNGLAIMLSAPLPGGRCGGAIIQIFPTSNACSVVQAALIKQGKTLGVLEKLPLVETANGVRNILMPTVGGGCTIVSLRQ